MVEQPLRESVAAQEAAVPAAGEEIHDVAAVALGIVAADAEIARGAGGRREQQVGDRVGQGCEHRLGDALAHLGGAARHRPRILGIEERALGLDDVQRLEGAGVDRHVGEDVLDGEIDRRLGGGDHAVHRPAAGRARARHVEGEVLALLGDLHPDGERLVDHAVAVDLRGALVDAVGNVGDLGAHLALGAVAHLGDRRPHDVARRSGRSAPSAAPRRW